ncbi:uncharacterized protein DUF202 [Rhodococcus sp. SMB37]|uniref:DUF202 domain-containing protein n=1 Tax=Rhodococcus sp. SMB37 TaxID=2512213 RepID=UPI0006CFEE45|nr:DUF202 domain-containing protein [Rhodococcus sp. SMB37]TCN52703.1 uncharacterized protein DUF202 [Rhodococcus sp. SMB37]
MTEGAAPLRDPGLQPERTALSWTRTSAAMFTNGLLVGSRDLFFDPGEWVSVSTVAAVAAFTAAAAIYVTGRRRAAVLSAVPLSPRVRAPSFIAVTAATNTVLCVALLVVALVR